ncbi:MAG: hypothetical protein AB7S74_05040 [Hyphomicrobium sp.]
MSASNIGIDITLGRAERAMASQDLNLAQRATNARRLQLLML